MTSLHGHVESTYAMMLAKPADCEDHQSPGRYGQFPMNRRLRWLNARGWGASVGWRQMGTSEDTPKTPSVAVRGGLISA